MASHSLRSLVPTAILLSAALLNTSHAEPPDAARYLRERGWNGGGHTVPQSPTPDLIPIQYSGAQGVGASCSLLTRTRDGKVAKILLAGENGGWPDCITIETMTSFTLNKRDYVAVTYLVRDTREDYYRYVDYFYRHPAEGYKPDESLAVVLNGHPVRTASQPKPDVIAFARAKHAATQFGPGEFLDPHFISDKNSWFAALEGTRAKRCRVLVQSSAAPVAFEHTEFAPGTTCTAVLATTRLLKPGALYYLAMFEHADRQRHIAIVSVGQDGRVSAQRALADGVKRVSSFKDIRSTRNALEKILP